jgi:hypothetical protein
MCEIDTICRYYGSSIARFAERSKFQGGAGIGIPAFRRYDGEASGDRREDEKGGGINLTKTSI